MAMPEGTRLYLLAPVVRGRKGEYRKELQDLQKRGFQRVKVDGTLLRDRRGPGAQQEAEARHRGRGRPRRGARRTSATAWPTRLETALGAGRRACADRRERRQRGERTHRSPPSSPARSPASPSTRSSRGCSRSTTRSAPARPATGWARKLFFDPELVVPDDDADACARAPSRPGPTRPSPYYDADAGEPGASTTSSATNTPWEDLPEKAQQVDPVRLRRRAGHA